MTTNQSFQTGSATLAGCIPTGHEGQFQAASLESAEFGRLPKPGHRCPISAMSRSGLLDLGVMVPGLLIRIRRPGRVRGTVLVHLETLRGHLRALQQQAAGREVQP